MGLALSVIVETQDILKCDLPSKEDEENFSASVSVFPELSEV